MNDLVTSAQPPRPAPQPSSSRLGSLQTIDPKSQQSAPMRRLSPRIQRQTSPSRPSVRPTPASEAVPYSLLRMPCSPPPPSPPFRDASHLRVDTLVALDRGLM